MHPDSSRVVGYGTMFLLHRELLERWRLDRVVTWWGERWKSARYYDLGKPCSWVLLQYVSWYHAHWTQWYGWRHQDTWRLFFLHWPRLLPFTISTKKTQNPTIPQVCMATWNITFLHIHISMEYFNGMNSVSLLDTFPMSELNKEVHKHTVPKKCFATGTGKYVNCWLTSEDVNTHYAHTVQVVSNQPITAQRGMMSEHSTSFDGWITAQIYRIKSHLSDWLSGVERYCKK